ncbi:MAG: hypothetical protein E7097_01615 [Bacteroides sp.]|nr:hypothetical protein [Bacteroides sp.]
MLSNSVYIPNELFFAEVQAQIRQGKKVKIRVRGNSMLPFIRNNDEALLIPPTPEKIRKGTPVVAQTDELGIVLHRIHRIDGNRITLLGDGNINQFEHTSPERVIAVVSHYYRGKQTLRTDSLGMRIVGRLWMAAHPWRRKVLTLAWKVKRTFATLWMT